MASIQSMCSAARLLCDEPLAQKPSPRRILQAVEHSVQSFYSQLESSGQPWALKPDYTLNVSNGTSDYLLSLDNSYGKPIQVLTYWPANPSLPQRYVEFYEIADLNFDWGMPVNVASMLFTDGSPNTAIRMAFYYRDDGSRWVRVLPQPQLFGSYLITFASGDWASSAALETDPVLSQFHSLIEIWAAESVLPSCQWSDNQNYNMSHRKEIALALQNDRARIEDDWQRYIRNTIQDHITIRQSSFDRVNDWS